MASRGRVSLGAWASNSDSVRSAQSAAHTASTRRSASLRVKAPGWCSIPRILSSMDPPVLSPLRSRCPDKCGCGPRRSPGLSVGLHPPSVLKVPNGGSGRASDRCQADDEEWERSRRSVGKAARSRHRERSPAQASDAVLVTQATKQLLHELDIEAALEPVAGLDGTPEGPDYLRLIRGRRRHVGNSRPRWRRLGVVSVRRGRAEGRVMY